MRAGRKACFFFAIICLLIYYELSLHLCLTKYLYVMTNFDTLLTKLANIDIKNADELQEQIDERVKDTFDSLEFKPHPTGIGVRATYPITSKDKGLIISIVGGDAFYGDGKETFEVGLCLGGTVAVAGWKTKQEVATIIELLSDFNR